MKKKFIVIGVVLATLAGTWELLRLREPIYEGKKLSVWMRGLAYRGGPSTTDEAAIRRMGTNAIPSLLKVAKVRRSLFYGLFIELNRAQSLIHFDARTTEFDQEMAIWGFRCLGPAGQPAVPALMDLLKDHDPDVRATAAYCLGLQGVLAEKAVPALIGCLSSSMPREKAYAAYALGEIGAAARSAIPKLNTLTNDSIWFVSNAAQAALMKLEGRSFLPLIEQLKDTSNPLKWYPVAMLVSDFGTNAEAAIPTLVLALAPTNNDIVLGHAALALANIHRQPEACVPALIPLLSSPSVSTRQKSLVAIRAFGAASQSAVPAIIQHLNDPDPWTRMQAALALREIDPKAAAKAMAGRKAAGSN
jgi:HEAT repeat protein